MGYDVVNFEVGSSNSFRDIKKNHFMTMAADMDDGITRKRNRVSLKNHYLAAEMAAVNIDDSRKRKPFLVSLKTEKTSADGQLVGSKTGKLCVIMVYKN